jgi:hypothetical protein
VPSFSVRWFLKVLVGMGRRGSFFSRRKSRCTGLGHDRQSRHLLDEQAGPGDVIQVSV